jgi:hypothetical protein
MDVEKLGQLVDKVTDNYGDLRVTIADRQVLDEEAMAWLEELGDAIMALNAFLVEHENSEGAQ